MSEQSVGQSCEQFQQLLPELIGSGQDLTNHPHLSTCPRCSALLAELETIAEAARQLLPIEEPSDDLWNGIAARLREESGQPD